MVGGGNDRRHQRGLSLTMAPPTTVRGGHELERQKGKKNEMKNKENERKERGMREDEGKGGWRENGRKKVKKENEERHRKKIEKMRRKLG